MSTRREFSQMALGSGLGAALATVAGTGMAGPAPPRPRGRINVLEHGVRGDGETDDTAAIQALFDTQPRGLVYFPAGRYIVTRTIRVRSQTSIAGDAARATYIDSRIDDGSPTLDIGFPDFSRRLRGVRLEDLTVRGSGPGRSGAGGIRLHAFYDSIVKGVRLQRLGWGLEANRAIGVQFDNLGVSGMRKDRGLSGEGVYLYAQCNGCLFNKYRGIDNDGAALRLGYGQGLTLSNPILESNGSTALVVGRLQDGSHEKSRAVTVLNPYFENNRPYDMAFLRGNAPTLIQGYWGPMHDDYVAPIDYHLPMTVIGTSFPRAPGGAVRIARRNAKMLFLGCSFEGKVATFANWTHHQSAALRLIDAEGDRLIGEGG
jgi:hypothetical protein